MNPTSWDILAEVTGILVRSPINQLKGRQNVVKVKLKAYLKHAEVVLTFWALSFAWSVTPIFSGSLYALLSVPLPEKSINTLLELNNVLKMNFSIGKMSLENDIPKVLKYLL